MMGLLKKGRNILRIDWLNLENKKLGFFVIVCNSFIVLFLSNW